MRRGAGLVVLLLALAGCGGGGGKSGAGSGPPERLLHPERLTAKAPARFDLTLHTTKGDVVVNVRRSWSPHGADRLYELARAHFFDGVKFFRVVRGFVVQFGISPYPEVSKAWENATIPDDPVVAHNTRGTVTFATAGPDTRTTQLFVNLADNPGLDGQGFAPVGTVTSGMDVVDELYGGYGDRPTAQQGEMQSEGNAWLEKHYPKLDAIESTSISR